MIRFRVVRPPVAAPEVVSEGGVRESTSKDVLFPHKVSGETEDGHQEEDKVEDPVRPQTGDDPLVLGRETDRRRHGGVEGEKEHGEHEGTRDGCE